MIDDADPRPESELALLLGAAPAPPTRHPQVAAALSELVDALPRRATGRRSHGRIRRLRWVLAIAGVCAGLLAIGTATAGTGAWTGFFGNAGDTEDDTSQWLDVSAANFPEAVRALAPGYVSYPAGTGPAFAAGWIVAGDRAALTPNQGPASLEQVSSVRGAYESFARCLWDAAWLRASNRGDEAAAAQAAATLRSSAEWPNTKSSDAGGVVASLLAIAAAAKRGDAGPVRHELAFNCQPGPWFLGTGVVPLDRGVHVGDKTVRLPIPMSPDAAGGNPAGARR